MLTFLTNSPTVYRNTRTLSDGAQTFYNAAWTFYNAAWTFYDAAWTFYDKKSAQDDKKSAQYDKKHAYSRSASAPRYQKLTPDDLTPAFPVEKLTVEQISYNAQKSEYRIECE